MRQMKTEFARDLPGKTVVFTGSPGIRAMAQP